MTKLDNLTGCGIMQSVVATICLLGCKGVSAEEQSKGKTL